MAHKQGSELVDPSKRAFAAKAVFVNASVEQAFWPGLGAFAVADVVRDVGNDPMVETHFARSAGVERRISVKVAARNHEP